MSRIHPTAVIETGATLGNDVQIGPYCVVGENVRLADKVVLHSHVVVGGETEIGEGTEIYPFASIGLQPQDKKFHGERTRLIVGKHNMIREHVTMNPGTEGGGALTQVGDNNLFMVGAHVAHDCIVGNHVILANNATLAGHVIVGDGAIIGGLSAIHQFVRIGAYAMIGGMSGVEKDVIPYGSVMGERANLAGLNLIGLKRRNVEKDNINALRHAYKELFESEGTLAERAQRVHAKYDQPEVRAVTQFILGETDRAICTPARVA
jgi:UDP-N-acetylglucosamine acyltransferase